MTSISTRNGPTPIEAYSPYRGLSPIFPRNGAGIIYPEDESSEGDHIPASALRAPSAEKPDNTLDRETLVVGNITNPSTNGNFVLRDPATNRPIPYTRDQFTGKLRPRLMMDDLFDKVKKEDPEKLAEYGRRREITKEDEEAEEVEEDEEEPDEKPLVVATITNPPPTGNFMVREPGTNRLIPHTRDQFTGKVRRRQMIDDFFDNVKKENPAKFDRIRRQRKEAYRKARQLAKEDQKSGDEGHGGCHGPI